MANETDSSKTPSLQNYESIIKEKLSQVVPEEVQLSNVESQDFERLSNAANLWSTFQDIQERKKFAKWIFWMVVGWLVVILAIIILTGVGSKDDKLLAISDAVILGLIGSTTVNVTAFFVIVTKYLFPTKNGSQQ